MRDQGVRPEQIGEVSHVAEPAEGPADALPRSVDGVGLAAFLLGGLALPVASLPFLSYLAGALAVVGAGLGVLGVVRGWNKPHRPYFAGIGLGACLLALLLAAWAGPRLSGHRADSTDPDSPRTVRLHDGTPTQRNVTAVSGPWVDARHEAAQQGVVRVRVLGATVGTVPIRDEAGQKRWSPERVLALRVRLSNVGLDRVVRYVSWSAAEGATVVDQLGRGYPARKFAPGWEVIGQVRRVGLIPGKWADDLLVFAPPARDVLFLRLTLPASAFGGKGVLRLEIPRQMIVFR
jgi:hypothetical protein